MNKKIIARTGGAVVIFFLLFFSYTAWNQTAHPTKRATTDTVPKTEKKIRNLDEALMELDNSKAALEQQMKSLDWQKMEKELNEATKKLDGEKIKLELEKAVQQVDAAKIQASIEASLSKVDFDKIKKEMERVKEIDIEKIEADLKNMGPEIEKSMNDAKAGIEKARVEMTEYKSFVDGLEKEGLIRKNESYKIEIKNGKLIINGKEQTGEVYNKFRPFLEKHQNTTIEKSAGDFNIHKN